jgi:branched-chain amino acid transport system substrate-binding protein
MGRFLFRVLALLVLLSALSVEAMAGEFRVGALLPLTGSGHPYGPSMLAALKIARDEINASGGVLGDRVRLIALDSGSDPSMARAAAVKLIEDHHVAAILGTWSSDVTLGVLPLTTSAGVIAMTVSAAPEISDIGRKTGLVFRTQASDSLYGEVFAEAARRAGFTRAAVLAVDLVSNRASSESFIHNFKRKGGVIAAHLVYPDGRPSYEAELSKVLASAPQIISLWSYWNDTRAILRAADKQGYAGRFLIGGWAVNPKQLDVIPPRLRDKIWIVNALPHMDSESYLRFADKLSELSGEDAQINPYPAMVYDQLMVLALAAEAAKSTAPKAVRDKIVSICSPPGRVVQNFEQGRDLIRQGVAVNFDGASSELMFDEAGDVRPDFAIYRIENEELRQQFIYRPYY